MKTEQHLSSRLSRRAVLRGAGATLALPWLEMMAPAAKAAGGSFLPPARFAGILFPNGVRTATWRPPSAGALTGLPTALEPLAPVKDDVLVVSGLANNLCKDSPHHRAIAGFLTGASPQGQKIYNGVSADQWMARYVGQYTRLPSLELGLPEVLQKQGSCDGFPCTYTRNIAWRTPTTPVPKEINPRNAFDLLFRHLLQKARPEGDERPQIAGSPDPTSVLDHVLEDARRLRARLGRSDQVRLDQYLNSVREVEQRINRVIVPERGRGSWSPSFPDDLARFRPRVPGSLHEHLLAMMDLIALAFQTDSTRVATFMLGYGSSWNSYPESGVSEQHHTVSHYGEKSGKADLYTALNRYHVECFTYLVKRLKGIPEGGGSLLDNVMVLFGSELGVGGAHNVNELPVLLAGRGCGTVETGRHLVYPRDTPMASFLIEVMQRMQLGADVETFGEGVAGLGQLS